MTMKNRGGSIKTWVSLISLVGVMYILLSVTSDMPWFEVWVAVKAAIAICCLLIYVWGFRRIVEIIKRRRKAKK